LIQRGVKIVTDFSDINTKEYMTFLLKEIFGAESGEDGVWDDGAEQTAERWIRAMAEFSPADDIKFKFTTFPAQVNQLIVVTDIEFSSLCAHHLFPFVGKAHVGYLPNRLQVGLSKIPRLVHHFATRPTTQERLTESIAHYLKHELQALGTAVITEATHTCMSARGVREHNGVMRCSEMRGVFMSSATARQEFLSMTVGRAK
jgi:GTP cyclohydrolase I